MASPPRDLQEQILSTAKRMFIRQGYHGLAMRQIAEALSVSKAALYYYYTDKEQLFLAILSAYLDEMEAAIDSIQAQPAPSRVKILHFLEVVLTQPAEQRAIIRLATQEMAQLRDESRLVFGQVYRSKFIDKIKRMLLSGMQSGEFRQGDPEVAAWALLGIMYPYFYPAHTVNRPVSPEVIEQLGMIYLEGIQSPQSA